MPRSAFDAYKSTVDWYDKRDDRDRRLDQERTTDESLRQYVTAEPQQRQSTIRDIAARPGSGAVAKTLFSEEEKALGALGDKVHGLLKSGQPHDLHAVREIAKANGLQIPDEVFTDAKTRAWFTGFLDQAKGMGVKSEDFRGAVPNQAIPPQQAALDVARNLPEERKLHTTYTTPTGEIGAVTMGPSGPRAQPLGAKGTTGRGRGAGQPPIVNYPSKAAIGYAADLIAQDQQLAGLSGEDMESLAFNVASKANELLKTNRGIDASRAIQMALQDEKQRVTPGEVRKGSFLGIESDYFAPDRPPRYLDRRMEPAVQQPASPAGGAATNINDDAQYDALPSGSLFIGPDGITRQKP